MKVNHDLDAQKAFYYPLEESSISSAPPSHKLNKQLNILNNNHNNIIELAEGKTTNIRQSGGYSRAQRRVVKRTHGRQSAGYSSTQQSVGKTTNGGLNIGDKCVGGHCAIHIEPTSINLIHNNLLSANPPPNANIHYPVQRQGNYQMPGISNYLGTKLNPGPFNLLGSGKPINSTYNYIINPLTNRKVKITTSLGKKIINNYIGMIE